MHRRSLRALAACLILCASSALPAADSPFCEFSVPAGARVTSTIEIAGADAPITVESRFIIGAEGEEPGSSLLLTWTEGCHRFPDLRIGGENIVPGWADSKGQLRGMQMVVGLLGEDEGRAALLEQMFPWAAGTSTRVEIAGALGLDAAFAESLEVLTDDRAAAEALIRRGTDYWWRWHDLWSTVEEDEPREIRGRFGGEPDSVETLTVRAIEGESGTPARIERAYVAQVPRGSCRWIARATIHADFPLTEAEVAALPEGHWEIRSRIVIDAASKRPVSILEEEGFRPAGSETWRPMSTVRHTFSWIEDAVIEGEFLDELYAEWIDELESDLFHEPETVIEAIESENQSLRASGVRWTYAHALNRVGRTAEIAAVIEGLEPRRGDDQALLVDLEIRRGEWKSAIARFDELDPQQLGIFAPSGTYTLHHLILRGTPPDGDSLGGTPRFLFAISAGDEKAAGQSAARTWAANRLMQEDSDRDCPRWLVVTMYWTTYFTENPALLSSLPSEHRSVPIESWLRGGLGLEDALAEVGEDQRTLLHSLAVARSIQAGEQSDARDHLGWISAHGDDELLSVWARGTLHLWDEGIPVVLDGAPPAGEQAQWRTWLSHARIVREAAFAAAQEFAAPTPESGPRPEPGEIVAELRRITPIMTRGDLRSFLRELPIVARPSMFEEILFLGEIPELEELVEDRHWAIERAHARLESELREYWCAIARRGRLWMADHSPCFAFLYLHEDEEISEAILPRASAASFALPVWAKQIEDLAAHLENDPEGVSVESSSAGLRLEVDGKGFGKKIARVFLTRVDAAWRFAGFELE